MGLEERGCCEEPKHTRPWRRASTPPLTPRTPCAQARTWPRDGARAPRSGRPGRLSLSPGTPPPRSGWDDLLHLSPLYPFSPTSSYSPGRSRCHRPGAASPAATLPCGHGPQRWSGRPSHCQAVRNRREWAPGALWHQAPGSPLCVSVSLPVSLLPAAGTDSSLPQRTSSRSWFPPSLGWYSHRWYLISTHSSLAPGWMRT